MDNREVAPDIRLLPLRVGIKNANNYQWHMETHYLVTMGWLCGRGECKATYRHGRGGDYVSHIKSRNKLENYSAHELLEVEPVVIILSKRGEVNQGRMATQEDIDQ